MIRTEFANHLPSTAYITPLHLQTSVGTGVFSFSQITSTTTYQNRTQTKFPQRGPRAKKEESRYMIREYDIDD